MTQFPEHHEISTTQLEERATTLRNNGQIKVAIEAYVELKERFMTQQNLQRAAEMQHMIGVCHKIANHHEQAIDAYTEATRLYQSVDDQAGVGRVERDKGIMYQYNDNFEQAQPLLEASVANLTAVKASDELGISEVKLGNLYRQINHLEPAEWWIRRGIERLKATAHWFYTATALMHLAELLISKEDFNSSLELLDEVEVMFESHGGDSQHYRRYAQIEAMRAMIYGAQKDNNRSAKHKQNCEIYLSKLDDDSAVYLRNHDFKHLFNS